MRWLSSFAPCCRRPARVAQTPNQALQQTGAACRLSGVKCRSAAPAAELCRSALPRPTRVARKPGGSWAAHGGRTASRSAVVRRGESRRVVGLVARGRRGPARVSVGGSRRSCVCESLTAAWRGTKRRGRWSGTGRRAEPGAAVDPAIFVHGVAHRPPLCHAGCSAGPLSWVVRQQPPRRSGRNLSVGT